MKKILVINSSPRHDRSHSRATLEKFVSEWTALHPDATLTRRDFSEETVPFVTESWVIGAFTPVDTHSEEAKAAIAVSDAYVDEFLAADAYVFGVPMYNLSIPAIFKAYIDQIVRAGRTFGVGPEGYFGLVKGKKALFVTASGGAFRQGTPMAGYNFQEPYLRAIFGFIGITDIEFIVVDSQNIGEEAATASKLAADAKASELAKTW